MRKTKTVLVVLCSIVISATAILGTLAYLFDMDGAVNTFTIGKVDITVDETKINADGTPDTNADRVTENVYHLIPGATYVQDPTMTVLADSEASYVRMMLTINCMDELDAIYAPAHADLRTIFNGYDPNEWRYVGETRDDAANEITYEFRYKEIVDPNGNDLVLDALYDSFTIPAIFDSDDIEAIKDLKITAVGHAIQQTGFANEDSAWIAFDSQIG